jgi:hypothetical protein
MAASYLFEKNYQREAWWGVPVITVFVRLRQEDLEFKISLITQRFNTGLGDIVRHCLKKSKEGGKEGRKGKEERKTRKEKDIYLVYSMSQILFWALRIYQGEQSK